MCPSPKSKGLMVDHLSARATKNHFNHVLDALEDGRKDFGPLKVIMLDSYEVKTPIDWTPDFRQGIPANLWLRPAPWLPVLAGKTVTNPELSERFRHDYGKLVSDLTIKNHFGLARQHGQRARSPTARRSRPWRPRPFGYPQGARCHRHPDGGILEPPQELVRQGSRQRRQSYGKPLVNAESMTGWQHWQDGPANVQTPHRHRLLRRPQPDHLPHLRPQPAGCRTARIRLPCRRTLQRQPDLVASGPADARHLVAQLPPAPAGPFRCRCLRLLR